MAWYMFINETGLPIGWDTVHYSWDPSFVVTQEIRDLHIANPDYIWDANLQTLVPPQAPAMRKEISKARTTQFNGGFNPGVGFVERYTHSEEEYNAHPTTPTVDDYKKTLIVQQNGKPAWIHKPSIDDDFVIDLTLDTTVVPNNGVGLLRQLAGTNNLTPEASYRIKFNTKHRRVNDPSNIVTGIEETLTVKAVSKSELHSLCSSAEYPYEHLYYMLNPWAGSPYDVPGSYGVLYRRIDPFRDIDLPYDWRNCEIKLWPHPYDGKYVATWDTAKGALTADIILNQWYYIPYTDGYDYISLGAANNNEGTVFQANQTVTLSWQYVQDYNINITPIIAKTFNYKDEFGVIQPVLLSNNYTEQGWDNIRHIKGEFNGGSGGYLNMFVFLNADIMKITSGKGFELGIWAESAWDCYVGDCSQTYFHSGVERCTINAAGSDLECYGILYNTHFGAQLKTDTGYGRALFLGNLSNCMVYPGFITPETGYPGDHTNELIGYPPILAEGLSMVPTPGPEDFGEYLRVDIKGDLVWGTQADSRVRMTDNYEIVSADVNKLLYTDTWYPQAITIGVNSVVGVDEAIKIVFYSGFGNYTPRHAGVFTFIDSYKLAYRGQLLSEFIVPLKAPGLPVDTYSEPVYIELAYNGYWYIRDSNMAELLFSNDPGVDPNAEQTTNKVSLWQDTPSDTAYPTEKLVYDALTNKANKVDGKVPIAEIPTGTSSTHVAVGNHYLHGLFFTDQPGQFTISGLDVNLNPIMVQTWTLNNPHGTIENPPNDNYITLSNAFTAGARVRITDLANTPFFCLFPAGHSLGTGYTVDTYVPNGACFNSSTNLWYYFTSAENSAGDTVEFVYLGNGNWRAWIFDLESIPNNSFPLYKLSGLDEYLSTNYSPVSHNHDTVYAPINYTPSLFPNLTTFHSLKINSDGSAEAHAYFSGEVANTIAAGVVTIDWKKGNCQTIANASGSFTINAFGNPSGPSKLFLRIIHADGNAITPIFTNTLKFGDAGAPTYSTGANKVDIIAFYWDGTSYSAVASTGF